MLWLPRPSLKDSLGVITTHLTKKKWPLAERDHLLWNLIEDQQEKNTRTCWRDVHLSKHRHHGRVTTRHHRCIAYTLKIWRSTVDDDDDGDNRRLPLCSVNGRCLAASCWLVGGATGRKRQVRWRERGAPNQITAEHGRLAFHFGCFRGGGHVCDRDRRLSHRVLWRERSESVLPDHVGIPLSLFIDWEIWFWIFLRWMVGHTDGNLTLRRDYTRDIN